MTVKVGDRVRSFDFECRALTGPSACYVEGEVLAIGDHFCRGYDQYHIKVDKQVFAGRETAVGQGLVGEMVYPPVNGVRGLFGPMNGVEKIE